MTAWATGMQIGPYLLAGPIGSGGMGEVWKARDTRLDRIVAIKRLKGQHTARFDQEARAIAALNHPHICQIHDVGPDYLAGGSAAVGSRVEAGFRKRQADG
jgi:eukaryotic-like serine/threonine-protein kinase